MLACLGLRAVVDATYSFWDIHGVGLGTFRRVMSAYTASRLTGLRFADLPAFFEEDATRDRGALGMVDQYDDEDGVKQMCIRELRRVALHTGGRFGSGRGFLGWSPRRMRVVCCSLRRRKCSGFIPAHHAAVAAIPAHVLYANCSAVYGRCRRPAKLPLWGREPLVEPPSARGHPGWKVLSR